MEKSAKQTIHLWLLKRITEAQYLCELQEAGNLVLALELTVGLAALIAAWEEKWAELEKKDHVSNFRENGFYKRVLDDLREQDAKILEHLRMRQDALSSSLSRLELASVSSD